MSETIRVFHLLSDKEQTWYRISDDPMYDRKWAVAYCHCEENNMLSALHGARYDNKLPEFYESIGLTVGRHSIGCGDWATKIPTIPTTEGK